MVVAGDAFTAGFIHGLLAMDINFEMFNVLTPQSQRSQIMNLLVSFASACGALTCTKEGAIAAQPTIDEVRAFLVSSE
jgi:fructokinase